MDKIWLWTRTLLFLNVLVPLLEDEGYEVDAAKSGVEALSKIVEKDYSLSSR